MPIGPFVNGHRLDAEDRRIVGLAFEWSVSPCGLETATMASNRPSPRRSSVLQKLVSTTPISCANGSWRTFAGRFDRRSLIAKDFGCVPDDVQAVGRA